MSYSKVYAAVQRSSEMTHNIASVVFNFLFWLQSNSEHVKYDRTEILYVLPSNACCLQESREFWLCPEPNDWVRVLEFCARL